MPASACRPVRRRPTHVTRPSSRSSLRRVRRCSRSPTSGSRSMASRARVRQPDRGLLLLPQQAGRDRPADPARLLESMRPPRPTSPARGPAGDIHRALPGPSPRSTETRRCSFSRPASRRDGPPAGGVGALHHAPAKRGREADPRRPAARLAPADIPAGTSSERCSRWSRPSRAGGRVGGGDAAESARVLAELWWRAVYSRPD